MTPQRKIELFEAINSVSDYQKRLISLLYLEEGNDLENEDLGVRKLRDTEQEEVKLLLTETVSVLHNIWPTFYIGCDYIGEEEYDID